MNYNIQHILNMWPIYIFGGTFYQFGLFSVEWYSRSALAKKATAEADGQLKPLLGLTLMGMLVNTGKFQLWWTKEAAQAILRTQITSRTDSAGCKLMTFSHISAFLWVLCYWYPWQSISHLKEISPLSLFLNIPSWRLEDPGISGYFFVTSVLNVCCSGEVVRSDNLSSNYPIYILIYLLSMLKSRAAWRLHSWVFNTISSCSFIPQTRRQRQRGENVCINKGSKGDWGRAQTRAQGPHSWSRSPSISSHGGLNLIRYLQPPWNFSTPHMPIIPILANMLVFMYFHIH